MTTRRYGDMVTLLLVDPIRGSVPRRGRPRASAPRRRQVLVRVSEDELVVIKAGALNAGFAVGAWLRGLAMSSADCGEWELAVSRPDVVGQLLRVRVDLVEIVKAVDGNVARRQAREALRRVDALIGRAADGASG